MVNLKLIQREIIFKAEKLVRDKCAAKKAKKY